jgi:hypothetical protein
LTIGTMALAVVFLAGVMGCSQQRCPGTCDKHSACGAGCACCKAKCAKMCHKSHGHACPKGCTKPCCAKAAGKPINQTCPIEGKPLAGEIVTGTCCGKTVGFCSKECLEQWKKLSGEEKCKKLGCTPKCKHKHKDKGKKQAA